MKKCGLLLPLAALLIAVCWRVGYSLGLGDVDLAVSGEASGTASAALLVGKVIVVDAGHGLPDGGCTGRTTGVQEQTLNLDVAKRLQKLLEGAGATVVMIREDDYALHPRDMPVGNRKKTDFANRAEIVASSGADILISIHMNQYPVTSRRGALAFSQLRDAKGAELAECLTKHLRTLSGSEKSVAQLGDYFMLRQGVPGALVECGFLSNAQDEANLILPEHRQKVALAIAQGLARYFAQQPAVYGPALPG